MEAYRNSLTDGVTLVSLNSTAMPDGDGPALADALADGRTADPLLALAEEERRAMLGRMIDTLPERERQVLALYYYEELTMREVGVVLGVTESRVSQLHSSAIQRMTATRSFSGSIHVRLPPAPLAQ